MSTVWVGLLVMPLSSCDKVGALVDKAKGLMGEEESAEPEKMAVDVSKANEEQAKEIIMAERRMVIVEFYSDT